MLGCFTPVSPHRPSSCPGAWRLADSIGSGCQSTPASRGPGYSMPRTRELIGCLSPEAATLWGASTVANAPACQGEKTASSRAVLLGFSTLSLNWYWIGKVELDCQNLPSRPPPSCPCVKSLRAKHGKFFQCSLICHQDSLNVPSLNVPENLVKNAGGCCISMRSSAWSSVLT